MISWLREVGVAFGPGFAIGVGWNGDLQVFRLELFDADLLQGLEVGL